MKSHKTFIIFTLIFVLLGNIYAYSQNNNKKKFQAIVKQKLIEKLNINDSTAEKCISIYNNSKDKIRKLQKERKNLMQNIEDNSDSPDILDKVDRLLEIDSDIYKIKKETVEEMKGFLTPKQIAQSIIFQKNLRLFLQKEIKKRKNSDE